MRNVIVLLIVVLLGFSSCNLFKKEINNPYEVPEDPITLPVPDVSDLFLKKLLQPESLRLPEIMRHKWPYKQWSKAKVYVYNFVKSGPPSRTGNLSRTPWDSPDDTAGIEQTILLTHDQALAALELIHRTGGGFVSTKCPIFIRHAVVFFNNADEPIGWMGICFECTDSKSSPAYYPSESEHPLRYELYNSYGQQWDDEVSEIKENEQQSDEFNWNMVDLYDEVFEKWKLFFDYLGAKKFIIHKR